MNSLRWLTILPLTAILAACGGGGGDSASGGGDGGNAEKLKIAAIPKSTGGEFWQTVEAGVRDAAAELDVDLIWEGTATETEIAEQNRIIESMITLGIDGIALAPLNNKAQEKQVKNAVDAGIPVVIFDSAVDGEAHSAFVATDNIHGGELGAASLSEAIGGPGKVVLMRYIQGTASTEARCTGFIAKAKETGLEILADPYPDNGQIEGCKMTAANTLAKYVQDDKLELDGVFAANLTATLGVAGALDDMQKMGIAVDHVKFIGFDTSPKLLDLLEGGQITGLIAQDPKRMGYLAVESIVKVVRGEAVETFVDTGVTVVTADKLSDPAIRKLVGLD